MEISYMIAGIIMTMVFAYIWYRQNERIQNSAAAQEQVTQTLRDKLSSQEELVDNLRSQLATYEQESAQSNALFSTTSNVAYDYVFVIDEKHTVITCNRSAMTLFGDGNPVGEKLQSILVSPDLDDIIARAVNEEETLEDQFAIDKHYYRARAQMIPYSEDTYFVGVAVQDITQLVRLNRARRDMVANISHELRTPITKIRFVIDSLFHDQNRPKRKASITSLREISQEIGELEDIVQALLDLSMIESKQAIMKLVDESLIEIVNAAIERLQERLNEKEIKIIKNVPEKMAILCDREHIRRVFVNLIGNAIKWSPQDDVITISATNQGEEVIINVFDNGPGVPDDQRERIFERFYQVDTARSGKDGSGLGLAICKHIIEAHGGEIWAEGNSQGNGGRFEFTLLNAKPSDSEDVYMDRGQHDVILNPSPAVIVEESHLESS